MRTTEWTGTLDSSPSKYLARRPRTTGSPVSTTSSETSPRSQQTRLVHMSMCSSASRMRMERTGFTWPHISVRAPIWSNRRRSLFRPCSSGPPYPRSRGDVLFPEITNIFASLERSVVRSSVTPSAKYCCSRSSLRFVKGSTTIDRRGVAIGGELEALDDTLAVGMPGTPSGRNA